MKNLSNYKAVILAGGKGTRLYPITYEIPKPLLPVRKKPIINYLVDLFSDQGIKEIVVLINKDFREEFDWWQKRYYPSANSGRGPKIKLLEETEPLGTFGGLWYLKNYLSKTPFFFTNGDELKKIDLKKMAQFHNQKSVLGTIALVKVPDFQNYGVVICEKGIVQEFLEKPKNPSLNYSQAKRGNKVLLKAGSYYSQAKRGNKVLLKAGSYINSGLYLFSPEIFKYHLGPQFAMVETDVFPKLAKEQKLAGFKFEGEWMDCGTFDRYEQAIKNWHPDNNLKGKNNNLKIQNA